MARSRLGWSSAVVIHSMLLLGHVAQADVIIDPLSWGLNPGDTFRLVVVTTGGTTGSSTSIDAYDAFVNAQGLSGITYGGASLTWQAVAGTPSSNPVGDGTRFSSQANATQIFNLSGALVSTSTNGTAFWQTSGFNQHLAAIDWTIDGSGGLAQVSGSQLVWTGFDVDGSAATAQDYDESGFPVGTVTAALGQAVSYNGYDFENSQVVPSTLYPLVGRAGALFNGWSAIGNEPLASVYPLYAMSELITVAAVPEPSTFVMAVAGLVGGGLAVIRRRRRP